VGYTSRLGKSLGSNLLLLFVVLILVACAAGQSATTNTLISVVFKTNADGFFPVSPPMSGPDPAATSANPLFGVANVWNNLEVPFQLNTNPSWSDLVDSTGSPNTNQEDN